MLNKINNGSTPVPGVKLEFFLVKKINPRYWGGAMVLNLSAYFLWYLFVCLFRLWHDPAVLDSAFVGLPI